MTEGSKTERKLVRVVPNEPTPSGYTLTQGTKVLLPSGEAIPGIRKLTLICEANSTWRAILDCHVEVPEITGVEYETTPIDETRARTYDATPLDLAQLVAQASALSGTDVVGLLRDIVEIVPEFTENTRQICMSLADIRATVAHEQARNNRPPA